MGHSVGGVAAARTTRNLARHFSGGGIDAGRNVSTQDADRDRIGSCRDRRFRWGPPRRPDGTNFAVTSTGSRVELCLFDAGGQETRLPLPERTGAVMHGFVPGVGAGQRYGYRVTGPYEPATRAAVQPGETAAGSVLAGDRRAGPVRPRGARPHRRRSVHGQPARLRRAHAPQSGAERFRFGRFVVPSEPAARRHCAVRNTCQGIHRYPPGRPAGPARHLRRTGPPSGACPPDRNSG